MPDHVDLAAAPGAAGRDATAGMLLDEPTVVLTSARSGSTLLRFLLDAHPALACPPETNLVKTAVSLASTWMLLKGGRDRPLEPGEQADDLPPEALTAVRSVLDAMFGGYLARQGKQRWCDKSLGTVEAAEAFLRIYPRTRFLCLYRHCMDVVASGLEACPWGVSGYGFDPYVSNSPGNNAAALAHYWADHTTAILQFEQAHPEACLRVHYEDLASDPEGTAASIWAFLGTDPAPGIAKGCLTARHDAAGPADYKIWATSEVTDRSVGRGTRIPASTVPAPLLGVVNDLLGSLGYLTVADDWNTRDQSASLLTREPHTTAVASTSGTGGTGSTGTCPELDTLDDLMASRITSALASDGQVPSSPLRRLLLSARPPAGTGSRRSWQIDLEHGTVSRDGQQECADDAMQVTGDYQAWMSVLTGTANLGVALRHGELRCSRPASATPLPDGGLTVLASLLGLSGQPA